jgi:Mn-dependent DtxR family transcriptional regulator
MEPLTIDALFEAVAEIQLLQERSLMILFSAEGIRVKFPTTRRLAEHLRIPHYYMLPYFGLMEKDELVTRAERVGIMTTAKGSRKFVNLVMEKYRSSAESVLGAVVFAELAARIREGQ